MALTKGNTQPDRYIKPTATPADAPQTTGNFAFNSGDEPDLSTSATDLDAKAIYSGDDATRMNREAGTAQVAVQHTTGTDAEAGLGSAFIDGSTLGAATKAGGSTAKVPGSSGFPGLFGGYPGDQT